MGIIHHTTYPRLPFITKHWTAIGRWTVPLACVLQGSYGRRKGQFLYTVFYEYAPNCSKPLYTGMTRKTVFGRLQSHISAPSDIGRCIHVTPIERLSIEVIEITGVIRMAEYHRIQELCPPLNRAGQKHTRESIERTINSIIRDQKKPKNQAHR